MDNSLIINSIKKSIAYSTYRTLIKGLLVEGKSTGSEQSESLFNFSKLNDKRMDRLDKTLKISTETSEALNKLTDNFTLLVLAEGWCGDAAQILPVINKIAESSSKIDLKIVCRDENEDLMNQFLTNGGKAIPKVIVVNNKNEVLNSWGPRPSEATKMVNDYKAAHGGLDDIFKKDLQIWYNKDKGNNTQKDLLNILEASTVEVI
jgi:thioredoxin-like negative regulator of GroEL